MVGNCLIMEMYVVPSQDCWSAVTGALENCPLVPLWGPHKLAFLRLCFFVANFSPSPQSSKQHSTFHRVDNFPFAFYFKSWQRRSFVTLQSFGVHGGVFAGWQTLGGGAKFATKRPPFPCWPLGNGFQKPFLPFNAKRVLGTRHVATAQSGSREQLQEGSRRHRIG